MNTIKFSHKYTKMTERLTAGEKVLLLQVFKTHRNQLSTVFVSYDTEIAGTNEHYELPKNEVLVLLFMSEWGHVFTTIRRWTPQKEDYYVDKTGHEFEVAFV